MEVDRYTRVLETVSLLLDVLQAETTTFVEDLGPLTQSVWDVSQEKQIKQQILGMLKLIPDYKNFNEAFD